MSTNTLGFYNPYFYANEALIQLEKALGMAGRIYRGYDEERRSFGKGDTINIRRPGTFTAQDAPSAAQNINAESVALVLNKWKEVKFELTDKELAFTGERIIEEHIRPAAYALADNIDSTLAALYKDVPWYYDAAGGAVIASDDIPNTQAVMFTNGVPLTEGQIALMVSGTGRANLLTDDDFVRQQTAGQLGQEVQLRGTLGTRYGCEIFANQNVQSHTKGTINDTALQVLGATAAGATTISFDAVDAGVTGTLVAGDTFVIAGNNQRYSVTATNTASSNAFTAVTFTPPLAQAHSDNDAVTVSADNHVADLMFHRNAFALAMAPLSDLGNKLGAQIASITDPKTGLALRSRVFYVGDSSKVVVALDVLYGVKTLDPNLACRLRA